MWEDVEYIFASPEDASEQDEEQDEESEDSDDSEDSEDEDEKDKEPQREDESASHENQSENYMHFMFLC